jgi:hypothetical protein
VVGTSRYRLKEEYLVKGSQGVEQRSREVSGQKGEVISSGRTEVASGGASGAVTWEVRKEKAGKKGA